MHPGYKAAIYEFILISDSGIRSKFISNIRGPQKRSLLLGLSNQTTWGGHSDLKCPTTFGNALW